MYLIAQNYGESLTNLRKANNKWNDLILPGQLVDVAVTTDTILHQPKPTVIKYTSSYLNLLARLITAEAQGEPYNAQVAVGAVVVNRVKQPLSQFY